MNPQMPQLKFPPGTDVDQLENNLKMAEAELGLFVNLIEAARARRRNERKLVFRLAHKMFGGEVMDSDDRKSLENWMGAQQREAVAMSEQEEVTKAKMTAQVQIYRAAIAELVKQQQQVATDLLVARPEAKKVLIPGS